MRHHTKIKEHEIVLWVNFALFGIIALLFFYYVMMANSVAAKNYKAQTLRDEVQTLSEENSTLLSRKMALESPTALLEYARSQSLVEAKNVVYIFENRNVARR